MVTECDCETCSSCELIFCRRRRVVCETQDPIPQSEYDTRLEGEMEQGIWNAQTQISDTSQIIVAFSSIESLYSPSLTHSGTEAGWGVDQGLFRRYNKDTELMEGAFPLLVENCDHFQGMQIMHDASTLGGFSHAFLTFPRRVSQGFYSKLWFHFWRRPESYWHRQCE
ncbi:uncharacterized protein BJ212DRAFT_686892 [Suillus subaureus]|uniref:Uncharacterized protein n=1 Tax=Suillus subaureus TaxID=48587 RepID=A0A9P7EK53_9AGAM|nr:uncharacterized protein BJ212DRAFT_686892 [Suillus subaureus]KAG1823518.1 hypothetical protein BJ212DRAFT_686892 [Suillus subaureus]